MRHYHFLKSTRYMRTPRQGPQHRGIQLVQLVRAQCLASLTVTNVFNLLLCCLAIVLRN